MVICIICLGIESSNKGDDDENLQESDENGKRSKVVSCFLAILLGLVAAVLMTTKHLIIRLFNKTGYAAFDQAVDSAILEGILTSFLLIPLFKQYSFTFEWTDLAWGSLAGFLMTAGRILIAIAVAEGIAGPAQSLMSTHALYQALWTAIFASQPLTTL